MKKLKKFLIIPLVALLFGVLPQRIVFAEVLYNENGEISSVDNEDIYNVSPLWDSSVNDLSKISLGAENIITLNTVSPVSSMSSSYQNAKNFIDTLFTGKYPVEFVHVDTYNKHINYLYLTDEDLKDTSSYYFYGDGQNVIYRTRFVRYSLSSLSQLSTGTISGWFGEDSSYFYKVNKLNLTSLGLDNYLKSEEEIIEEEINNHPSELPKTGNGILITAPKSGSKINKLEYNAKGYLEQIFTLRVQYKPKEGFFGLNDDEQKMDIIKGISCDMEDSYFNYHIFNDSFQWIVKPSKAIDSVSSPYAIAEIKISTVFKDLGRKKFIVNSALKVADDSEDITRDIRQYSDSIYVEFVSDEEYQDGVVINPDGTTGTDGSNSDINLDGFPTAPGSNGTIVDWVKYFGDVIIWLVTYPFKLLANCFTVLGGYITVMVKTLQSTSEQITGLFTFIPKDILNVTYGIISFTLLYSVTRGVLRLIRGN